MATDERFEEIVSRLVNALQRPSCSRPGSHPMSSNRHATRRRFVRQSNVPPPRRRSCEQGRMGWSRLRQGRTP